MNGLTIGQLARKYGVQVETIKFYQRRGLIEQPPHPESGFRKYSAETVRKVRFIRRAKELGFSLQEIGELLDLRVAPGTSCREIKARAEARLADIRQKQKDLERMEEALRQLTETCQSRGPLSECTILGVLDDMEEDGRDSSDPEDAAEYWPSKQANLKPRDKGERYNGMANT